MKRAYIFLNGDFEPPARDWPRRPAAGALVIAADGGGRHVLALGWPADVLVGDFDSLSPETLQCFETAGAELRRHPAEKDEIDFELALALAMERGATDIEVLGALGGRWDMTLGNLFLPMTLTGGAAAARIRFRHGDWSFLPLAGPAALTINGAPGDLVSLLPLGGDATGLVLSGCRYPLDGETLRSGFSRGLSNELTAASAQLKLTAGRLLLIHHQGSALDPGCSASDP
jgi:thiamine pyrophosphokinase